VIVGTNKSAICRAGWHAGIQVRVDVVVLNLKFLGQTNRLETQAGFYVWRQNSFSRKFLCFKAFNQLDENNPHYGNNLLRVR